MDVLNQVLAVFDEIGTWIPTAIEALIPMFYTAPSTTGGTGSLTFLGVLAVAGLSISVVFLLIGVIQNFLHFRG